MMAADNFDRIFNATVFGVAMLVAGAIGKVAYSDAWMLAVAGIIMGTIYAELSAK